MRKLTPKLKISDWYNYVAYSIPDNTDYINNIPSFTKMNKPIIADRLYHGITYYANHTHFTYFKIEYADPISYNGYCTTEREVNEMDKNKIQIEDIILNSVGLKNKAKAYITKYGITKIKNYFGCELLTWSYTEIRQINSILKELDSKNTLHIIDPCEIKNITSVLKLRNDTFVYVNESMPSVDKDGGHLYLYFFGKKAYAYKNKIASAIKRDVGGSTRIYNLTTINRNDWKTTVKINDVRDFDTLYFDGDIDKDIKSHLDSWIDSESIYKERGLLFKTGILLYGEPGTGKSSIALAIASYLKCNIINIDLSNFSNFNIGEVVTAIDADKDRYVILLDEIDTLFKSRDDQDTTQEQKEAISKLLALLDSAQSPNNVVFVATTNYIDRLDKAVIREGRFDKQYCIKNISKQTAIKMCYSFGLTHDEINKLLRDKVGDINPAKLQVEIVDVIKRR